MILGGHGITAWGATSDEAEAQLPLDHRARRRPTSTSTATAEPFGPVVADRAALPEPSAGEGRRARAPPAGGRVTGLAA